MENWVERKTPQGRVYHCNLLTQETTWDRDEIDEKTGRLVKTNEEGLRLCLGSHFFIYFLCATEEKHIK